MTSKTLHEDWRQPVQIGDRIVAHVDLEDTSDYVVLTVDTVCRAAGRWFITGDMAATDKRPSDTFEIEADEIVSAADLLDLWMRADATIWEERSNREACKALEAADG